MHDGPPTVLRALLRTPVVVYRVGGGRLLGHRFLLLAHRGRRTGRVHRTMLEVVQWRRERREAVVLSGWGREAQWYRNLRAGGAIEVRIGGERFVPEVRVLDGDEAAEVLSAYERANRLIAPVVRRLLTRLSGVPHDGSPAQRRLVVEALPMLALRPRA